MYHENNVKHALSSMKPNHLRQLVLVKKLPFVVLHRGCSFLHDKAPRTAAPCETSSIAHISVHRHHDANATTTGCDKQLILNGWYTALEVEGG